MKKEKYEGKQDVEWEEDKTNKGMKNNIRSDDQKRHGGLYVNYKK
jgi:hypothetical protein